MRIPYDLAAEPKSFVFEAHRHMKPVAKFYILFWKWEAGSNALYRIVSALDGHFVCVLWWNPYSDDLDDLNKRALALVYPSGESKSPGTVHGRCKVLGV